MSRLEYIGPHGSAEGWVEGFQASSWREIEVPNSHPERERRFQSPRGDVCRVFPNAEKDGLCRAYVYPPGGTGSGAPPQRPPFVPADEPEEA